MTYGLFHNHSHYSLLDCSSKPKDIIKRAKELELSCVGVTDHGNIGAHPDIIKEARKQGQNVALGIEWYVTHGLSAQKTKESRALQAHMPMIALNKEGWKTLIKAVSHSNDPENFYYRPRIGLKSGTVDGYECKGLDYWCADGNLLGISGHSGSLMSQILWCNPFKEEADQVKLKIRQAYSKSKNRDPEYHRQFLQPNWLEDGCETALMLQKTLGKNNFYIELQDEYNPLDKIPLTFQPIEVECLREISKVTGIPAICSGDAHYVRKEDSHIQRVMLMNNMKTTEQEVQAKINSQDDHDLMAFFGSDQFYMHSREEMKTKFTEQEIENTNKISERIEQYDIKHDPYIPKAEITIDIDKIDTNTPAYKNCKTDQDKELMYLCLEGIKEKSPWSDPKWESKKISSSKKEYWERIQFETDTIFEYKLSDYFLLVLDIIQAAKNRPKDHSFDWRKNKKLGKDIDPIMVGQGRGSVAGSLVSYALGITGTRMDSIYHKLAFSRFINPGRMSKDHISPPDIDIDFETHGRGWVIEYIKWKYGKDHVAQNITFQSVQGKAAIKDVVRIKGIENGYELANELTKFVPNEAAISDQLQKERDSGKENYGIIDWCTDHSSDFQETLEKTGLKDIIQECKDIESTIKGTGVHPAAIIITPEPIGDLFPLVWDTRSKTKVIGFDYKASESCGALKIDALAVSALDKVKFITNLINKNND